VNNELVVTDESGNNKKINVIDIVQDNQTGKEYIFYTEQDKDEINASILSESEESYSLETIEDDKEWELVEQLIEDISIIEGDNNE